MDYHPIDDTKNPHGNGDNIELKMRPDARSYRDTSPDGGSLDTGAKDGGPKGGRGSHEGSETSLPMRSQRAAALTPLRTGLMVFDAVLASTPIMFVALALTAARLDGRETSRYGSKLTETLLLSPTIFPLIFAALMGRFFRHLGLWLAQRGTTLGRLEQLIGCQSVFSALERQICLRSWSLVGILSVFVWLLSPIGGQSALRLLDQEQGKIMSTATVRYMNPLSVTNSIMGGASALNSGRGTFTSIFLAALLSSSKYQDHPMDLWGNVKLPLYRSIANSTSDNWKIVGNSTNDNTTYASLIGIPVVGLPLNGFSEFNIRARQFDVACSSNEKTSDKSAGFGLETVTWKLRPVQTNSTSCANVTECTVPACTGYPCPVTSKSLANDTEVNEFSVATCGVSLEYFEAGVRCNGSACAVYRMKKLDLFEDGYTANYDDFIRYNCLSLEMSTLPTVDSFNVASQIARGSTNMEKWMADPRDFIGVRYDNVELWRLSPQLFSERLTILYNTFWQSTYGTTALGGNLPKSLAQTGVLGGGSSGTNVIFNSTKANTILQASRVYKTDWKWFSALLVCSMILLIAAYASLILKYMTLAPDIIGYASSLTLSNPHIATPTGSTTLHGLERSALLHNLPVKIGDVRGNEPVGAIAFANADDTKVTDLDRKRWYI